MCCDMIKNLNDCFVKVSDANKACGTLATGATIVSCAWNNYNGVNAITLLDFGLIRFCTLLIGSVWLYDVVDVSASLYDRTA